MKGNVLVRGLVILGLIWGLVWGVSLWMGQIKASPERVETMIGDAEFSDWSQEIGSDEEAKLRREKLAEISEVVNRLDLRQRQALNESQAPFDLFFKLTNEEKSYFVDLTFTKSAERLMEALDEMDQEERDKMIKRAIRDMTEGMGAEAFARLREDDPEILNRIAEQGFRAYYQNASAETKMALRPLMDAAGEVVQGFAAPGGGF